MLIGVVIGAAAGWLNADVLTAVATVVPILIAFLATAQQRQDPQPPAQRARELAASLVPGLHDDSLKQLEQWGLERGRRIAVRWRTAAGSRPVPDIAATVPAEGNIDELADSIGRAVRQGSQPRLVITGDWGAGKTATALLLMTRLTAQNAGLPVLFKIANWHPGETPLPAWLAGQLLEILPAIGGSTGGARNYDAEVAEVLANRHVLPVLDGLDDMGDPATALRRIDVELAGRPFVLTCRTATFAQANMGYLLHQVLVIELLPLVAAAVAAVLLDYEAPGGPLTALAQNVTDFPAGPVAVALCTPFTTSLARASGAALPDLLALASQNDPVERIQQQLLATFIERAYPPDSAESALRHLRFLARHADAAGRIAWWRLHLAVPRSQFVINAMLIGGLICAGLVAGFFALFDRGWLGFWIGLAAGVAGGIVVELVPQDDPRLARPRLLSARVPTRRELARVLGFGAVGAAALAVISGALSGQVQYIVSGSLITGMTFAAARYLGQPNDPLRKVTPHSLLAADRLTVGVSWLTAAIVGALTGLYLGFEFRSAHRAQYDALAIARHSSWQLALIGAAFGALLTSTGVGLMSSGSSAWARFVWTRIWLAFSGSLPLGLMRFLSDADKRDVLRQVSGYYEFRHQALRRYLADPPPGETTAN